MPKVISRQAQSVNGSNPPAQGMEHEAWGKFKILYSMSSKIRIPQSKINSLLLLLLLDLAWSWYINFKAF
ncbi:MAG: hypothetical protein LJE89_07735, partial [Deltaproteobacteria bacterium]|nr:hypothetical protein [Deltaproteobacteria bacterium]